MESSIEGSEVPKGGDKARAGSNGRQTGPEISGGQGLVVKGERSAGADANPVLKLIGRVENHYVSRS